MELQEGGAQVVKFFCELREQEASRIHEVVLTTRLDVQGDGTYLVPTQEDLKCRFERAVDVFAPNAPGGSVGLRYDYEGGAKDGEKVMRELPRESMTNVASAV